MSLVLCSEVQILIHCRVLETITISRSASVWSVHCICISFPMRNRFPPWGTRHAPCGKKENTKWLTPPPFGTGAVSVRPGHHEDHQLDLFARPTVQGQPVPHILHSQLPFGWTKEDLFLNTEGKKTTPRTRKRVCKR